MEASLAKRMIVYEKHSRGSAFVVSIHFLFIWSVFQNISRLAVQFFADGFEGGEADSFGLACLKDGEVGGSDADFVS